MTQPHIMMGGYHVPAMITRDRLNNTLADLELRELVNLLADKGVTISIGALHAVRFGSTQRVTRQLAGAVRTLAHEHQRPVDDTIVYLGTEDAKAFIHKCRRTQKAVKS